MPKNKNPHDYLIVTKTVGLDVHGASTESDHEAVSKLLGEEPRGLQMTFWIVAKDGTYEQRYSVDSCPKWVKNIYRQKTGRNI